MSYVNEIINLLSRKWNHRFIFASEVSGRTRQTDSEFLMFYSVFYGMYGMQTFV